MKTKSRRFHLGLLFASVALSSGCQAVWGDLARQPYEDAMRKGWISSGEYMRISDQIDQAANPPPPVGRIPDKHN